MSVIGEVVGIVACKITPLNAVIAQQRRGCSQRSWQVG